MEMRNYAQKNSPFVAKRQPAATGSAAKALRVLAATATANALTPQELCVKTGLSRTAVHRAIHVLLDEGFLRHRLGRREVILTSHMTGRLLHVPEKPVVLDKIVLTLDQICRHRRLHADLALLTGQPMFEIVESTDASRLNKHELPLDSDLFAVALTLLAPTQVLSVTTAILKAAGNQKTVSVEFLDRYRWAKKQGYLWDGHANELAVPLVLENDTAIVLRLWSQDGGPRTRAFLMTTLAIMHQHQPELFPDIG